MKKGVRDCRRWAAVVTPRTQRYGLLHCVPEGRQAIRIGRCGQARYYLDWRAWGYSELQVSGTNLFHRDGWPLYFLSAGAGAGVWGSYVHFFFSSLLPLLVLFLLLLLMMLLLMMLASDTREGICELFFFWSSYCSFKVISSCWYLSYRLDVGFSLRKIKTTTIFIFSRSHPLTSSLPFSFFHRLLFF